MIQLPQQRVAPAGRIDALAHMGLLKSQYGHLARQNGQWT